MGKRVKRNRVDFGGRYRDFLGGDFVFRGRETFTSLLNSQYLWKNCGKGCVKVCGKVVDLFYTYINRQKFFTVLWISLHNWWESVESFTGGFTHRINRGKNKVLHIFHRAYYNYY